MKIEQTPFGTHRGRPVVSYTLTNEHGLQATLISFGARLSRMLVPDRHGAMADVVLGFDDLAAYETTDTYFGATCGRYGNRIAAGRFELDGATVALSRNEAANHLHGGSCGLDKQVWDATPNEAENAVTFTLVSNRDEEGYPGCLTLSSTYRLTEDDHLMVTMTGITDAVTILNMVHHTYWNLAGHSSGDISRHLLAVEADFYTPVDTELLATGEILSVVRTPFDFRCPKAIGTDITSIANAGIGGLTEVGGGYDHNWVLRGGGPHLRRVATLLDPHSGRAFTLKSSEPGVQIYTGGYLSESVIGKSSTSYRKYAGLTFETQKFPGSPNFAHFPTARFEPGELYNHRMDFEFFAQ